MLAALRRGMRPLERLLPACSVVLPTAGPLAVPAAASAPAASGSLSWWRWQGSDAAVDGGRATQADQHPSSGLHGQQRQQQEQQEQQEPHATWQPYGQAASAAQGEFFSAAQQEEDWGQDTSGNRADNAAYAAQRAELLAAALRHVTACGWAGGSAAAVAAAELGLSPAAAGMLGSDSEFVQLFVADCNRRLEAELADMQAELAQLDVRCAWLGTAEGQVA